ncbi:zinc-dependent alcohol dehydrogenase family protein [Pseudodesulfovibrio sp. zrk46]|uniref:zinc-dependent alcohol dehydrogenase family protein n=1 Tax=Pseudodesulfovibrio sp. zrk46 TaxID=2725288 RepID=UPI00144A0D95|nr:zinc-dependent alcohol dehydrogenase family protein [Pseudodesulfovibrio sp. zrk46]QJB57139.1 zinc-dependent alcohol dehydrogenase family protein [Pseudodesulfovibrio sp. zrk46]
MKAMLLERFGNEYAFVQREVEKPSPMPGQVLIRVAGSSFNPIDNKIATLGDQLGFAPTLPAVLGMDVSGVVEDVGGGMSRFEPGDKVFGLAGGLSNMPGALAEYMVADERLIARAPRSMDLTDAAALPLVSLTAWIALFGKARLEADETLLVHGGAGGVGHIAVQLGVYSGAKVYATVSDSVKEMVVENLGATPINYREKSVYEYVSDHTFGDGFDVVFDTVGGATLDQSFRAAIPEGDVVTTVARSSHDLSTMHAKGLSLHVVFVLLPLITREGRGIFHEILNQVARLVDKDRLAVLLDEQRFDYTDIAEVHRYWEGGNALGKIVIDVPGEKTF